MRGTALDESNERPPHDAAALLHIFQGIAAGVDALEQVPARFFVGIIGESDDTDGRAIELPLSCQGQVAEGKAVQCRKQNWQAQCGEAGPFPMCEATCY